MPAAFATWATTLIAGISSTSALLTATFWTAYAVGTLAVSYALSTVSAALMGKPRGLGNVFDRDIVVKTTTAPRQFIYGEVTCGGVLAFIGTTGDTNQYLDFVITVAGHQVESITDVWFDDELIANADINSGNAAGGLVGGTGTFTGKAYVYKYLGTAAQTASSVLQVSGSDGYAAWTSNHRGRGNAYVHIRLVRDATAYANGAPQNFRFKVKGAKVYDPRLDSTNGGSGAHRLTDATTWAWSPNAALCAADYLVGGTIVNDTATPVRRRGFGAPTGKVDWSAVITAANICDEDVAIPPSTTQDRYRCDCVVSPSEETPDADCIEQIYSAMLGNLVYTNGRYKLFAGAYQSPVYTLNEADLAGGLTYQTSATRAERYNTVRGTRFDVATAQEVEFLSRTDSSYVTADGRTLYHDVHLPATLDEYRAQRIAQTILRRSREQTTLVWPGQLSCAKIAVWETVQITVAELTLSSKVFRCIRKRFNPLTDGSDPVCELTLREEFASSYNDPIVSDYGSISVATDPGPTNDVADAPTALSFVALRDSIEFTWTPGLSPIPKGVHFELWEYTSSTPFSSATRLWQGASTTVRIQKSDNRARYYWVRAVKGRAVSATYPASTGMVAAAYYDQHAIVADPEFRAADLGDWSYNAAWWSYQSGGLIGGMARVTNFGSAGVHRISSYRRDYPLGVSTAKLLALVGTWNVALNVRYRVQSALSGSNKRLRLSVGALYAPGTGGETLINHNSQYVDLTPAVVGTWYNANVTLAYLAVGAELSNGTPFIVVSADIASTDVTAGTVDIDYFNAAIVG